MTPNPHTTEKKKSQPLCECRWYDILDDLGTVIGMEQDFCAKHAPIEKPATQEPAYTKEQEEKDWKVPKFLEGAREEPAPQQEGWEERFDEEFCARECEEGKFDSGGRSLEDYKDFIRTELAGQRERIAGEIEKMKERETDCQHTPNDSCDSDCTYQQFNRGWNDALLRSASIARATE